MITMNATKDWLLQRRELAWRAFLSAADPAKTVESWRRTPFSSFGLARLADARAEVRLPAQIPAAPEGIFVASLESALEENEDARAQYELEWGGIDHLKLELANRALWRGGLFVRVPRGLRVESPIRLPVEAQGEFAFPRLLVLVEEGAEATFIEEHRGTVRSSIAYSKVVLAKNARAHVVVQQELGPDTNHFYSQKCVLGENAQLTHTSLVMGSSVHKSDLEIELAGSGARSELFGMTLGRGKQHFDVFTKQWHRAARTTSDLTFRSALRDRSRSIYTGLVRIDEEARGTEAFQSDHNLLLSGTARADSTPILEILTDEVACKHAATAGQLDADELFYLAARGFSEAEAKRTLVMGFFEPVLKRLPVESERERLAAEIDARL